MDRWWNHKFSGPANWSSTLRPCDVTHCSKLNNFTVELWCALDFRPPMSRSFNSWCVFPSWSLVPLSKSCYLDACTLYLSLSLNISSTSHTRATETLSLDITFQKPCKRNRRMLPYPVAPWHLTGSRLLCSSSDVMERLRWAQSWLLRQMKCCGSWRGVHIMFLTSLWLPWRCVLHTQSSALLPCYEVTPLKYAAWREHCTVWVSGTVHSCLCYSPRMLKARSICAHFLRRKYFFVIQLLCLE